AAIQSSLAVFLTLANVRLVLQQQLDARVLAIGSSPHQSRFAALRLVLDVGLVSDQQLGDLETRPASLHERSGTISIRFVHQSAPHYQNLNAVEFAPPTGNVQRNPVAVASKVDVDA